MSHHRKTISPIVPELKGFGSSSLIAKTTTPPQSADGLREAISRAIDPGAWEDELPGMTRAAVEGFHLRRQQANAAAERVLQSLPHTEGQSDRADLLRRLRGMINEDGRLCFQNAGDLQDIGKLELRTIKDVIAFLATNTDVQKAIER